MDFVDLSLNMCSSIYKMAENMKANKDRCKRVAQRVKALQELVLTIKERGSTQISSAVENALKELCATLTCAEETMRKFSQTKGVKSFLKSSNHEDKFSKINERLTDNFQVLTGALQIEQGNLLQKMYENVSVRMQDEGYRNRETVPICATAPVSPLNNLPPKPESNPSAPMPRCSPTPPMSPLNNLPPKPESSPKECMQPLTSMPPMPESSPTAPMPPMPESSPRAPMPPMPMSSPTAPMPPMPESSPTAPMPMSSPRAPMPPMPPMPESSPTAPMPPMPESSPRAPMPPMPMSSPTVPMPMSSPTAPMPPMPESSPTAPMPPMPMSSPTAPYPPMPMSSPTVPYPHMAMCCPTSPMPPMPVSSPTAPMCVPSIMPHMQMYSPTTLMPVCWDMSPRPVSIPAAQIVSPGNMARSFSTMLPKNVLKNLGAMQALIPQMGGSTQKASFVTGTVVKRK